MISLSLVASLLLTVGCNQRTADDKDSDRITRDRDTEDRSEKDDRKSRDEDEPRDDETSGSDGDIKKAAAAACECMSSWEGDLSRDAKQVLIRASESSNPIQALQREILAIDDPEAKQEVAQELAGMQDKEKARELQDCTDRVDRKYKINSTSKSVQRQLISALEEESGCEVTTAFMKIGIKSGSVSQ